MTVEAIRLHSKLYRARCIAEAMTTLAEDWDGTVDRRREGKYHVVEAEGGSSVEARDLLSEVANAALVLTVDGDKG